MFNYHKTLNLVVVILLFTSCSNPENELAQETSQLRATFMKDKEYEQVIKDYSNLENSVKISLWMEKLNQLKSLNLSENHMILIQKLSQQLKEDSANMEEITSLAIDLAKITPEHDFMMMFGNLDDYSPKVNGEFHDNFISIELQENLLNIGAFEKNLKKTSLSGKVPDCNCSWTCDWYNNGYSNTNCNETTTGCGFLWLQSCDEKV